MSERPILFSGPMVRAILDGRKTQTRRVVKFAYKPDGDEQFIRMQPGFTDGSTRAIFEGLCSEYMFSIRCHYGQPGDRLWVKETGWERPERTPRMIREGADTWEPYYYDADGIDDGTREQFKDWGFKRRPSIFMPRWASRITLKITSVRVERLQDISEEDAIAEGIDPLFTEEKIKERPDLADDRGQWANYLWHGHFGKYGMGSVKSDRWAHQFSSYLSAVGSYSSLWESINGPGSWDANHWVWVIEFRRLENE